MRPSLAPWEPTLRMASVLDTCLSEFAKHWSFIWMGLACLLTHDQDILSVNALVGKRFRLGTCCLSHRYAGLPATAPHPPKTPWLPPQQQWPLPCCRACSVQHRLVIRMLGLCLPVWSHTSCPAHASLVCIACCTLTNIPPHSTQLSTGCTDNYLLIIILAPSGG